MAYIYFNEEKNGVLTTPDSTTLEEFLEPIREGYAIGYISGGELTFYEAADEEALVSLCESQSGVAPASAAQAVEWFKTNVGPVFLNRDEI